MKQIFGGSESKSTSSAPTGFQSLPEEAQQAFLSALERGEVISQDQSIFTPEQLTGDQTRAIEIMREGVDPMTAEQFQSGVDMFMNPYEANVLEGVRGDIAKQSAGQLSDVGSLASNMGAFGGTRQALLEQGVMSDAQKNFGNIAANLRQSGFKDASNLALENFNRQQGAAQNLFNVGEMQRGLNTQQRQAPMAANNYLMQLAQGFPTGGGQQSYSKMNNFGEGALAGISKAVGAVGSAMTMGGAGGG